MSKREIIVEEDWLYTLYKKEDDYYLSAVCGTIAVFTVTVQLAEDEKKIFEEQGEPYIKRMAYAIINSPNSFEKRSVQLPSDD